MHILLTRPLEDCSEMILKFKSLGHQVSHLPLLVVEKVNYDSVNFPSFGGIIFTSANAIKFLDLKGICLLYTSPSPRDRLLSRMPSSA